MRIVTDSYPLSTSDDAPVPAHTAYRSGELERKVWGDLAGLVARRLTAAGFRRHDPRGQRGGFHLSLWEDGVILAWSTTEYPEDTVSPFEKMVEHTMHPALEQILQATGFTARIIPEGEDNGGAIRVTGWEDPGGTETATFSPATRTRDAMAASRAQ